MGGSSGRTSTTSEASIAPELRPLFAQTGSLLARTQRFNPFGTPTIDMTQVAPGTFAAAPMNYLTGTGGHGEQIFQLPSGDYVYMGTYGAEAGQPIRASSLGPEGMVPGAMAPLPESLWGIAGYSPTAGPTAAEVPGSILDEFLFPRPQFIPGASAGQADILARQRQRAFGGGLTPQEQVAQGLFTTLGQPRMPELGALGLSQQGAGQQAQELAALGLGQRFGQFYGPEAAGLGIAGGLGGLRGPEQTALGTAGRLGQLTAPELAALSRTGGFQALTPQEAQALGLASGFGAPTTPEAQALQFQLGAARPGELAASGGAAVAGVPTSPEAQALSMIPGLGQLRGLETEAIQRSRGLSGLTAPEQEALAQIDQFFGGPIGSSPVTQAAMRAVREPIVNELAVAGLGTSGELASRLGSAYAPILAQEVAGRAAVIPQLLGLGQAQRTAELSAAELQARVGAGQRAGEVTGIQSLTNIGQALRTGSLSGAQLQAQIAQAQRAGDTATANLMAQVGEQMRAGNISGAQTMTQIGQSVRSGSITAAQMEAQFGAGLRGGDVAAAQIQQSIGDAMRRGDTNAVGVFQQVGTALRTGDIQQANNLLAVAGAVRQGSLQAAGIQAQIGAALRAGDTNGAAQLAELGKTTVARESALLAEYGASEEALRQIAAQRAESEALDLARRQQIAQSLTTGIIGSIPAITGQTTVGRSSGGK